jgi:hypothetical protein
MHTMLTLQLDSYEADGTPLQRNTLSFVELAAPEPKVRPDIVLRTARNQGQQLCCCRCSHENGSWRVLHLH